MEKVYYDPKQPGSYGGIDALYKQLRRTTHPSVTRKEVVNWLTDQETYNLHRPVQRRFKRRKIFSRHVDYLWQIDLCDLSSLAQYNDNYRYLLTVIDVFSKYAWAVPLLKKNAKAVTEAFESLLQKQNRTPIKVQSDKGLFYGLLSYFE